MNTFRTLCFGVLLLLTSSTALAQYGSMMGDTWGGGWMGGYGGMWMPILLAIAVIALVVWIVRRGGK